MVNPRMAYRRTRFKGEDADIGRALTFPQEESGANWLTVEIPVVNLPSLTQAEPSDFKQSVTLARAIAKFMARAYPEVRWSDIREVAPITKRTVMAVSYVAFRISHCKGSEEQV